MIVIILLKKTLTKWLSFLLISNTTITSEELERKFHVMTNATKSQSNGGTNVVYQDLPQVIKTLKNEPDDDFTKPNLTQWDKKQQKVPLID